MTPPLSQMHWRCLCQTDFGEFKGSFDDYIQFYTTSQFGTQISYNEKLLESCSDIADSFLLTSISEVSGVSMEEEGVDMTQRTKRSPTP